MCLTSKQLSDHFSVEADGRELTCSLWINGVAQEKGTRGREEEYDTSRERPE